MLFTGCNPKNDRLFQQKESNGINDKRTIINDPEYEKEAKYEYKIAPNDRLAITVYIQSGAGSKQMNSILSTQTVSSNINRKESIGLLVTQKGTVRLPLINTMKVVGLTQDEASALLINEYRKFIRNPYVTVQIINQRVIVVGEVQNPGVVPIVNGTMNLLEAIAKCGDITDIAERTNIKIVRGDLRNPEIRVVDLTNADYLRTSSLLLKPDDIVYVQARNMKAVNKAINEILPFFTALSTILDPFIGRKNLMSDSDE